MFSKIALLAARKPGKIVGPIASFLGIFYNGLFNIIFSMTQNGTGSLAAAIIIFTIIVKMILLPLTYKQQKSTYKMQKIQPLVKKIQDKYRDRDDRESQQRMAFEIQELQREHGVGMMSGCLPLLIQLPILYGLFYLFQQAYVYVDVIGANYSSIANALLAVPVDVRVSALTQTVISHGLTIDVAVYDDLITLVNAISKTDVANILSQLGNYASTLEPLFAQKIATEYFCGINLVARAGLTFPGIIIPILSGLSTWVSSKMLSDSNKVQMQAAGTEAAASGESTMKIMNIVMPIMMGAFAINMPAGLGLYWIITNVIQLVQTLLLRKHFEKKEKAEAEKGAA